MFIIVDILEAVNIKLSVDFMIILIIYVALMIIKILVTVINVNIQMTVIIVSFQL